jgi:hypothetical protein
MTGKKTVPRRPGAALFLLPRRGVIGTIDAGRPLADI